jgi:hypothetical protein
MAPPAVLPHVHRGACTAEHEREPAAAHVEAIDKSRAAVDTVLVGDEELSRLGHRQHDHLSGPCIALT